MPHIGKKYQEHLRDFWPTFLNEGFIRIEDELTLKNISTCFSKTFKNC